MSWILAVLVVCIVRGSACADQAEPRQVHLTLVGMAGKQPTLPERITSWFEPAEYEVSVDREAKLNTERILSPPPDGAVYVWVTVRNDSEARLYFASAQPGRAPLYSLREVALESGLDELGAERLSQIVHLSCLALFEGQGEHQRAEIERMLDEESSPPATQSSPPPTPPNRVPERPVDSAVDVGEPPPRPKVRFRLDGAVGYGLSYRSDEGVWHGPRLGLAGWVGDRLLVHLGVQAHVPHREDMAELELQFWGGSAELGVGTFQRWGNGFVLALTAGPGLDLVRYEPKDSLSEQVSVGSGDFEVRPQLGANLRLGIHGSALGAAIVLRGAYSLSRTHYDLQSEEGSRPIATPSRFLPTAGLELTF